MWASHAWRLVLLRSLGQSRPISTNLGQSRLLSATSCNSYSSASDVARITSKYAPAVCSSAALGERPCSKPNKGTGPGGGSIACGEEWYTPPAAGAVGSVQSTCSKPTRKSALVRSPTPLSVDHSKYAVTNQERGGPVSRTDGRSAEGQQRRRDVPRLLVAHQQHLERVVGRQASVGEVLHLLTAAGVNRRCLHQRPAWAKSFASTRRAEPAPSRARAARTTA